MSMVRAADLRPGDMNIGLPREIRLMNGNSAFVPCRCELILKVKYNGPPENLATGFCSWEITYLSEGIIKTSLMSNYDVFAYLGEDAGTAYIRAYGSAG